MKKQTGNGHFEKRLGMQETKERSYRESNKG